MLRIFSTALLLAALAVLTAVPSLAQTVTDSVRMELGMYQYDRGSECGAGVYAVWPNVLQDLLGSPDRTYGYSDYGKIATDGMYIPSGYGEVKNDPGSGISVPDGYLGHNPQLGGGAFHLGGGDVDCSQTVSSVSTTLSGAWGLLNASPFRVTEWYATFRVPDGTVIALFEWEQGEGLAADFDASFESGLSREVDVTAPENKKPVESYAWDFGDGETGTGARPSHTYEEPGEYTVRLLVTDDDGDEAVREESVVVHAAHLTVEVLSAPEEVHQGDTLTVVGQVTNSGTEPIFGVRAERLFTWKTRMPEGLNVRGGQMWGLDVEALEIPEGEEDHVSRARLDPGESFEVRRDYVVKSSATYRNTQEDNTFRPEDIYVDWTGIYPVVGETPEIDQVEVRKPCLDAEEPCATTLIEVPRVDLAVRTFLVGDTDLYETNTVRSGLVVGPSPRLPVVNGRPTRIADHRFEVDDVNRCRSGCIEFEVVAIDPDKDEPLADLKLDLTHSAIAGPAVVTPKQGGGFLCDRTQDTCGQKITLTTDAEGRVEGYLAVPGVINTTDATLKAQVAPGQPAPFNNLAGSQEHVVTIEPNEIYNDPIPVNMEQAADLATAAAIRVGFRRADLPNRLCNALKKPYNRVAKKPIPWSGMPPKKLMDDLCGWVDAAGLSKLLNAATSAALVPQMAWFFYSTQLPDVGLAESRFTKTPPFFTSSSQFVDELSAAIEGRLDDHAEIQPGAAPFSLHEVSYLWFDPSQGSPVKKSALYFRLWDHTALIDKDYQAGMWLVARYDQGLTPLTTLESGAPEGSTSVTTEGSGSPATDSPVRAYSASYHVTASATASGSLMAASDSLVARPDSLFANALVTLSPDDEHAETVRILSVTGDLASGQTAELASPLLYAHPSGSALAVVGTTEFETAPTPIGLTPKDTVGLGQAVRLSWATFQTVSGVDIEVARDPVFSDIVVSMTTSGREAVDNSVVVPMGEDGLLADVPYYWRARSRDRTGESAWSDTTRFVVTSAFATDVEEGPAIPSTLTLSAVYPNPVQNVATLLLALPQHGTVRVEVFNMLGQRVALMQAGPLVAGEHALDLVVSTLPSGVYVVRIVTPSGTASQTLTVVR